MPRGERRGGPGKRDQEGQAPARDRRGPQGTSPSHTVALTGPRWGAMEGQGTLLGQAAKLRGTTPPSALEGIPTSTGTVTCPSSARGPVEVSCLPVPKPRYCSPHPPETALRTAPLGGDPQESPGCTNWTVSPDKAELRFLGTSRLALPAGTARGGRSRPAPGPRPCS